MRVTRKNKDHWGSGCTHPSCSLTGGVRRRIILPSGQRARGVSAEAGEILPRPSCRPPRFGVAQQLQVVSDDRLYVVS